MLARMQARGVKPVVSMYMEAKNFPNVTSYNVVGELTGSKYPDQVCSAIQQLIFNAADCHCERASRLLGCRPGAPLPPTLLFSHQQGAMDDGGGAVLAWQVLSTALQLGMRPTRTLRVVMWSCEEFGGIGAQQYFDQHRATAGKMSLAMESDMGTFTPKGIQFTGSLPQYYCK
jgi:carboxypeptidase Q